MKQNHHHYFILGCTLLMFLGFIIHGNAQQINEYDVDGDGDVDYRDALKVWSQVDQVYNILYDVDGDDDVDYQDALLVWENRGSSGNDGSGNVLIDWITDVIWG